MANLLNGAGINRVIHGKRIKQGTCKISHTKINAKKFRDLNVKGQTSKLLEENKGMKKIKEGCHMEAFID